MKIEELEALAFIVVGGAISTGAMIDVYIDIWDVLPTFGLIGFCVVFLGKFLLRGIGAVGVVMIISGIGLLRLEWHSLSMEVKINE